MTQTKLEQWTIETENDTFLLTCQQSFMLDKRAAGVANGTLYFYQKKLELFNQFCDTQQITLVPQITPGAIRLYLLWLEEHHHNPGGIHACYRVLKTFLRWWGAETEPENWRNPISRVKAPHMAVEPLQPVELDTIQALINVCPRKCFHGERDRAILYTLLDTGARAAELCSMNLDDIDLIGGSILIRQGKGRKPRTVFISQDTRRAIRAYLKTWQHDTQAAWVTEENTRLTYWGLNEIIRRRAKDAQVKKPELHSFRRTFAINMLRSGVDVYSLQKLMGHTDLQVLRRYLVQTEDDTRAAHVKGSPVERLKNSKR
jgi:site-specific recombinase XerD